MTKKILYTNFTSTEDLIEKMLTHPELQKAIKRSNLYKFWEKAVGKKFSEKSRPYSMLGGGVMVVACENAIVAQELMLKKTQIIVKLRPYLKSLKMTLNDLRFDAKKWRNPED